MNKETKEQHEEEKYRNEEKKLRNEEKKLRKEPVGAGWYELWSLQKITGYPTDSFTVR